MRIVFCQKWGRTVAATDDRYVKSDRIRPGYVLHVMSCFAHAPEREALDVLKLCVRSGGQDVCIRSRAANLAKTGMSALNSFLVGEGDQVMAYFPDSDTGDTIELCINGFLIPIVEWRESPF
jgi:hypothetical protein